jgi:hypothetical protein
MRTAVMSVEPPPWSEGLSEYEGVVVRAAQSAMLPSMQILLVHGTMVSVFELDVPPPGVGLKTVIVRVPVEATSVPVMSAISSVELTNVVVRSDPLSRTTEFATKFVPSTVSAKPPLPAKTVSGVIDVRVGVGFALTVKV